MDVFNIDTGFQEQGGRFALVVAQGLFNQGSNTAKG
jgi:hypothetical protein